MRTAWMRSTEFAAVRSALSAKADKWNPRNKLRKDLVMNAKSKDADKAM